MDPDKLKNVVEAALLAAGRPMSIEQVLNLFTEHERPERGEIRAAIDALVAEYAERGIQLVEVASGWRIQVRQEMSAWLSRLWQDRPARYSRALLETLALIAYRQPITRGEIEDIRGVSVSSNIMRTLMERGWVRIVGYRDVPGRPGMYATTREFLDYFGLKRLEDLPPLAEIRDLDSIRVELDLELADEAATVPTVLTEEAGEVEEETDAGPPQESGRA
jgi:segregation and condensation protein B